MKKYHAISLFFIVGLLVGAGFLALAPESDYEKPEMVNEPIEPVNTDTKTISDIDQNEPEVDNQNEQNIEDVPVLNEESITSPDEEVAVIELPDDEVEIEEVNEMISSKYPHFNSGYFTENKGQWPGEDVRYMGVFENLKIGFADSSVYVLLEESTEDLSNDKVDVRGVLLKITFENSNIVEPTASGELSHRNNYFIGNDQSSWITDVHNYDKVIYNDLYKGIDLVYHITANGLKYDFVVKPGSDPAAIEVVYEGGESVEIESGELIVRTALEDIIEAAPCSYQGDNAVESSYKLLSANSFGFEFGEWKTEEILVIDPLVYSTYIGGGHQDYTTAIDVDSEGNAYVTGSTWYTTTFPALPTTPGAYSTTHNGGVVDSFVVKLNSTGGGLVYSTFIGGSSGDDGFAIGVDISGNAYVAGRTQSNNFPTTTGAFDTTFAGTDDAFISKLSANGSSLLFSTYLGGSGDDEIRDIVVDINGSVYATGFGQGGFPTTTGAPQTSFGGASFRDAVALKLKSNGAALDYSTYLGGNKHDAALAIAIDPAGNAYVAGETESNNFPNTTGALDNSLTNYRDAFVAKINPAGTAFVYSTYLGGTSSEGAEGIAVDSSGNAYVTGLTSSADFYNTTGAYDTTYNGGNDVYVTKLNSNGSSVVWSTFVGGTGQDWGKELELGSDGSVYVAASVISTDFPVTADAYNNVSNGGQDVVVMRISADGSSLSYSTYFGGTSHDSIGGMVWDDAGNVYLTGSASSTGFPVTTGAYDTTQNNGDGFISKLYIGVPSGPATNDTCLDTAEDIIDYLDGMDPSDFSNPNHQKTLKNKMNAVIKQIKNGSYCSAANKLENDILPKLDGEHPPPDWVTDPVAQQDLEDMVLEMIDCLRTKGGCP